MKNKLNLIAIVVIVQAIVVVAIVAKKRISYEDNYSSNSAITRAAILPTADALETFKLDMGEYPYPTEPVEEGKGLLALVNKDEVDLGISGKSLRTKDDPKLTKWRGPYLKSRRLADGTRDVPKDGWDRPFIYKGDGKNGFFLTSKGANPNDEADDITETSE